MHNNSFIFFSSALLTTTECVKTNLAFFDLLRSKCLLPERFLFNFPEPVTLKRFLALELVFILGIAKEFIFCKIECKVNFFYTSNLMYFNFFAGIMNLLI